jgi:hypothetical protein
MNRKLTLILDSNVVDFAQDFSKKYNKQISKIVENYFIELKEQNTTLKQGKLRITGLFTLRRLTAARATKNRSRATPFVRFFSATFWPAAMLRIAL